MGTFQETTTSTNDLGTSMLCGSATLTSHLGEFAVLPNPDATAEAVDMKLTK